MGLASIMDLTQVIRTENIPHTNGRTASRKFNINGREQEQFFCWTKTERAIYIECFLHVSDFKDINHSTYVGAAVCCPDMDLEQYDPYMPLYVSRCKERDCKHLKSGG